MYITQTFGISYFDTDPNNQFFAITHFLGGAWISLLVFWVYALRGKRANIAQCLIAALCIGIFWELFEILADLTLVESLRYTSDTLSDLAMDILGGLVGGILVARSSLLHRK